MRKLSIQKAIQKGSLMVEALAMLGLIAMVTPMVYKKAAERTTEMQDINEAGYLRIVNRALDDYILANQTTLATAGTDITIPADDIKAYLPETFNLESKMFEDISFRAKVNNNGSENLITGFVIAKPKSDIGSLRAARIASMIGTNGGFVDKKLGSDDLEVKGVQGVWSVSDPSELGIDDTNKNAIVTTSIQSIVNTSGSGSGTVDDETVLYRKLKDNDIKYNTMEVALHMNENNINNIGELAAKTATFNATADPAVTTDTTSITGGLIKAVSAALDSLTAGSLTADEYGAVVVDGTFSATGTATLATNTTITKGTQKVDATSKEISGDASLTVTGGANITGGIITDALETKSLTADDLYAKNNFGAGSNGTDYNLTATKDTVGVKRGTVTLSDGVILEAENLYSNTDGIAIGARDATTNIAPVNFLDTGEMSTTQTIAAPYFFAGTDTFEVGPDNDAILLIQGSSADDDRSVYIETETFNTKADSANFTTDIFTIGSQSTDTVTGTITTNENFSVDTSADLTTTTGQADFIDVDGNKTLQVSGDINSSENVYIRNGGIHVASIASGGVSDLQDTQYYDATTGLVSGYINVDRMVTNNEYRNPHINDSEVSSYERYQVNPGYTSVMNDIKLSSRGGARLSDILPDYITKGVYVLDNTYKDNSSSSSNDYIAFNWKDLNTSIANDLGVSKSVGEIIDAQATSCGKSDSTCEASPWLGFVPAPQCPPGYSKIATMAPLRFKAAEAYAINETAKTSKDYDNMLYSNKSPLLTNIEPLSFQAATWLNMSLQANNKDSSGTFKGWHSLMGFIYPFADYEDYLCDRYGSVEVEINGSLKNICGTSIASSTILWNLMPVYNQELSATVTTYCYFERGNFESDFVDTEYDQLNTYRSDDTKDGYETQLNDPEIIGYDDIW